MRTRTILTYMTLVAFVFALTIFLGNVFSATFYEIGEFIFLLVASASVAMIPTFVVWAIWNLNIERRTPEYQQKKAQAATPSYADSEEKRKRDRLDAVLRDLSDDELIRLRERLSDGSVNDDILYDHLLGEDGELIASR